MNHPQQAMSWRLVAVRRFLRSRWLVAHIVLLGALAILMSRAAYEDTVYETIAHHNLQTDMEDEEILLRLTHVAHELSFPRRQLVGLRPEGGLGALFLSTGERDLILGGGCGIASAILNRLLHASGFEARIAQVLCDEYPEGACHVVVEAKLDGRWVVLDPQYDHVFRNGDGSIAGVSQIRRNWSTHRLTVPEEYDPWFDYDGVRYTNWDLVPAAPLVRAAVGAFTDVETFSLRSHTLNRYALGWKIVFVLWLACLGGSIAAFVRYLRMGRNDASRRAASAGEAGSP